MLGFDALHRVPMKQHKSRNSVLEFEVAEEQPLLQQHGLYDAQSDGSTTTTGAGLSSRQLMGVYFSHILSTWNSRCYEFAAVSVFIQLAAFWRGILLNVNERSSSPRQRTLEHLLRLPFGRLL